MARKQGGKKAAASKPSTKTELKTVDGVEVVWETEPAAVYSNFAVASSRPNGEFSVVLCAISSEDPHVNAEGKLMARARIVASVRMHPQAFFALTNLLGNTWNRFVDVIGEPATKFQIVNPPPQSKSETENAARSD